MSKKRFDEECQDCRPMLVDPATMRPYSADSVEMTAVNAVWNASSADDRRAFHRFTCQNSRAVGDVLLVKALIERLEKALKTCICEKAEDGRGFYPSGACPIHGQSHGGGMAGHDEEEQP